jgi:hypothetical protein
VFRLGVQSARFDPELLAQVCTMPVQEMKFNVDWVPVVVPFVEMVSPEIQPDPVQAGRCWWDRR